MLKSIIANKESRADAGWGMSSGYLAAGAGFEGGLQGAQMRRLLQKLKI